MKTLEVVAGLVRVKQTVLVAKRNYGSYAGYWELPGGKVECGESQTEALAREWQEELGMTIYPQQLFHTEQHTYPEYIVNLYVYTASAKDYTYTLSAHSEAVWADATVIPQLNWLPGDQLLAQKIVQYLKEYKYK